MLSQTGHPNIVRVLDLGIVDTERGPHGFFTMEYIAGGSLEDFWRSHGSDLVPIETTIDLVRQVCRGLSVAHRTNPPIVHGHINPRNILVGYEPDGLRARVSDFGVAGQDGSLSDLASAADSVAFRSPESAAPGWKPGQVGDVWGLGTILYLLLTDHLPYDVSEELGWGNLRDAATLVGSPSDFNASASSELDQLVAKAVHWEPACRFQNAMALLEALGRWKSGESDPPAARQGGIPQKLALGPSCLEHDEEGAAGMAQRAIELKDRGLFLEAAELMEEAFKQSPDLRSKFSPLVRLWRCGISM